MKLTFLGAAHEVTGSCTLVEAAGHRFLVDCGMEQGRNTYENEDLPCAPGEIEAVLLTHAHIDHSGRLPYLYKNGYRGPIYATDATTDLCDIMLEDSAHIQEQEAEWKNRKAQRSGREPVEPDYTVQDALAVMEQFRPQPYGKPVAVLPGVQATFTDVGHLLGSSSITLRITEEGRTETIVFSGDIGNSNQPMLRDPQYLTEADYVVMESTYGNRSHGPKPDYVGELAAVLQRTFDRGGNVVIPSFAVGRTQEMLYFIRQIKAENRVRGHGNFEVYVDSPLASKSTTIFRENYSECFDQEALDLVRSGQNPLSFPGLRISETKEDSVAINADPSPKVILSASGMCDAGRIRHHLKHNLWRPECAVVFVGYQAEGSLGRRLLEGAKSVKLFGEEIAVNARIVNFKGLSSHADRDHLLAWIEHFAPTPQQVFVVHGDSEVTDLFAKDLNGRNIPAHAPLYEEVYDLSANAMLAKGVVLEPKKTTGGAAAGSPAFVRLQDVSKQLEALISRSRGRPNKDLARLADQIKQVMENWEN